ncbi:SPOR domain-containing protein [Microvirga pudoricolor]|uniref:SPOR domain-containing protein n=1 Tax=Microvirga pudoricolor TaxID=2778729 RepID=UPI00194E07FB|nr:SPOR domain-containing protein [Microvirga pudoricolor]MBM6596115.1 SPOR domain-containing protein [Microvirga pudoricolor]
MSESVKPRIAVDLNEIERQLASAQAAPHAAPSTRNDPLAELARIVGQDDPFQSLLAGDRQPRPQDRRQAHDLDDLYRASEIPAPRAPAQELRAHVDQHQAYDLDDYGQVPQTHTPQAYAYQQPQAAAHSHAAYDEHAGYEQGYYAEPEPDHSAYADEGDVRALEPRRSRKGLMAVSAVVAAAVIGGGAAWYATGSSAMIASGEPPLIKASAEPTKVQPDNPGGVEIPNQNKQIYERAKQTAETKVVNREEQPVDVKEATRIASAGTSPVATGATGGAQPHAANSLNLGEPKKVRTVSIRPDGTVAGLDNAPAAGSPPQAPRSAAVPPPPAMTMPTSAQPAPPTIQTASAAQPAASTPAAPAAASKPVAAPATPSGTSPQRVASIQPVAPAETAPAAVGGFSVQLGVRSSEGDAQKAFSQFQSKYANLQGQPALIRKAEVNGSTIYRVRVGPMSRDDASSLCSKLQGDGAQCFVAKN